MPKKVVKVVAGLGAASVIAVSGAALANSQTTSSTGAAAQRQLTAMERQSGVAGHLPGMHHGTPVTGATLTSVTNAVKAKDSAVTVKRVFKESDGSFHAMGTKAGKRVHIDVSKDLKTVTVKTGGPQGGPGGHGGPGANSAPAGTSASSAAAA